MDIPDRQVDDAIAYSLSTVVSPAQKSRAWEKLQQKAAHQVILAPYAVEPRPTIHHKQLSFGEMLVGWARLFVELLVTDEAMYQRAARKRENLQRMTCAAMATSGPQQVARFHMNDILRYGLL